MAATSNKYSQDTLNDKDGANSAKNIYALIPLALTEYKNEPDNSSESVATSDASFMSKFYVHDVWHFKDSDGNECVVGLLNPSAVTNAYYKEMHGGCSATAAVAAADPHNRKGKLRLVKGGVNYIVLNDGGLNTKPLVSFTTYQESGSGITHTAIDYATRDFIIMNITFQNAYYVNTDYFQLRLVAGNNDQTITLPASAINKAMKASSEALAIYTEGFSNLALADNTNFTLTISATNEEGTYTSGSASGTIKPHIEPVDIYLIENETDDTDDGTLYSIILQDEWFASDETDQPHNLLWFWDGNESVDPGETHPAAGSGIDLTASDVTIRGCLGRNYQNIFTGVLPAGMYLGLPRGPIPSEDYGSSSSFPDSIVWIDANGHPYKYKKLAQESIPVTPENDPLTWASSSALTLQIDESNTRTTHVESLGNNTYRAVIFTTIGVKATDYGKADINIKYTLNGHYTEHCYAQGIWTVRTTCNDRTGLDYSIMSEDSTGGTITESTLPLFELDWTPDDTNDYGKYNVTVEVTSTNPEFPSGQTLPSDTFNIDFSQLTFE